MAETIISQPLNKQMKKLKEGLGYNAVMSGNNWILPTGQNASKGDFVIVNGVFGKATAAIVGGVDAIIENTNWSASGSGGALKSLNDKMIDYANKIDISSTLRTANNPYTALSNGWILSQFTSSLNASDVNTSVYVDDVVVDEFYESTAPGTNKRHYHASIVPVRKGDIIKIPVIIGIDTTNSNFYFIPQ